MKTRNLFERLSKDNQEKIINSPFKALSENLVRHLKSNSIMTYMRLNECYDLFSLLDLGQFDSIKYFELFDKN